MGEKGNVSEVAGGVSLLGGAEQSLIERVTTTTTSTVVGVGEDLAGTIRDKAVEAVADATVASARDRLDRSPRAPGDGGSDPAGPAAESTATPPTGTPPPA